MANKDRQKELEVCTPPPDEFSSCEDLMANVLLRIAIWVLGTLAFLGNLFVIIWRLSNKETQRVHSFLIWNLGVSDFCMGIYLLIIAAVDLYYRGIYITFDEKWRHSTLCKLAGFLSFLSSEVSVFVLTVMTVDRFMCIVFPFRFHRLELKTAYIVIGLGWFIVAILGILPLSKTKYFGDEFYARSGVCLSLHLTNDSSPGWEYSVAIFLAVNLISFLIISLGYFGMYLTVKHTKEAVGTQKSQDMAVAKRMTAIVLTDFCCWMPIIIMGILALSGTVTIPGRVYAWTAVFILPMNSAINPILYTISVLGTKHKRSVSRKLSKWESEGTRLTTAYLNENNALLIIKDQLPTSHIIPSNPMTCVLLSRAVGPYSHLEVNDVFKIAMDIGKGLLFLHEMGIIHKRVDSQHVLIELSEKEKVMNAYLAGLMESKEARNKSSKLPFSNDILQYGTLLSVILEQISQNE